MSYPRLRNYTRSTGYVQTIPKEDTNNILVVMYFGVSATDIPTEAVVLGLTAVQDSITSQTFNFPTATNQYLYFAIPKFVQSNTLLTVESFPVNFLKYDVEVNVDGVPTIYEVNRSEYKQNGSGISGTITIS